MNLKLNSHRVFLIGVIVIVLFMLLNRFQFYYGSQTAKGTVVGFTKYTGRYKKIYPLISFEANGVEYQVDGLKDLDVTYNDTLEMIYQPSDPSGAVVNTFYGFWLYPIMFCLIPFIFWISFVYSYITPKESLFIEIGKPENKDDLASTFKYIRFSKGIGPKEE